MTEMPISGLEKSAFVRRLIVGVVLIGMLLVTLAGQSVYHSRIECDRHHEATAANLAKVLENEIAGKIQATDIALQAVIDEYRRQRTAGSIERDALDDQIARTRARLPEIQSIRLTDAQGRLRYGPGVGANEEVSVADRPHFRRLRDEPAAGLVMSRAQVSRVDGKWVMALGRRIDNEDGSFGGMAYASIALEHFARKFAAIDVGPRGAISLRHEDLSLLARYPGGPNIVPGERVVSAELERMVASQPQAGLYAAAVPADNILRTIAYRKVADYPLYILAGLSTEDYLANWRNQARTTAAMAALCYLIALSAAVLIYLAWKRQQFTIAFSRTVTDNLLQSNADLEQFAYSISHDMRQPLRVVAGHLQLLERGLKDRIDGDDRTNLAFALDGARRMDAMIVSLLEYSRVGRLTQAKNWMDSRAALDEALGFLGPEIEASAATIDVSGEWPRIFASGDELTRLFQNLIGNALKYHDAQQQPRIEIASGTTGTHWRVCVRDNGIGIDPGQIDRLFQFFSRLQSRARFDGTGMGLALCRKIVAHHDGHIWAESAGEGHGSRFCFEIPLAETGTALDSAVKASPHEA